LAQPLTANPRYVQGLHGAGGGGATGYVDRMYAQAYLGLMPLTAPAALDIPRIDWANLASQGRVAALADLAALAEGTMSDQSFDSAVRSVTEDQDGTYVQAYLTTLAAGRLLLAG
jgi:hypothetical protein